MLNTQDILKRLLAAVEQAGSQKAFALRHGLSEQYVSDVIRGRRELGQKILDALGVERIVSYREKGDG